LSDDDTPIQSVTRNLSEIQPNTLFIDARREGEAHVSPAEIIKAGPRAVLTNRPSVFINSTRIALFEAPELLQSLQSLACNYRRSFDAIGVGITGSVGKTTTAAMINSLLGAHRTLATSRNDNDELGIPVLAFALNPIHEYFVAEIGTWRPGEVSFCAEIVMPRAGVITNVGWAHLARFGSRDNIARAKAELAAHMGPQDLIVLNRDDDYAASIAGSTQAEVGWFSTRQPANAFLRSLSLHPRKSVFRANIDGEEETFELPVPGEHNVANALAAILVARRLGVSISNAAMVLKEFHLTEPARLEYLESEGITILDDSYNASPSSVRALASVLSNERIRPRVVVFGGMAELGVRSLEFHLTAVAELAGSCEILILYGTLWNQWPHFSLPPNASIISDTDSSLQAIVAAMEFGALVAFKGSRNTQTYVLAREFKSLPDFHE
jgi:UDP-N-acetylmuramoyl-tripeptide--D-alanyl-D-alanine ligase